MTVKALFYAYVLGGLTFIPLIIAGLIFFTVYTSVPVGDADLTKGVKGELEAETAEKEGSAAEEPLAPSIETNDMPRTRKGWLIMRRTFEESTTDGGYVTLVRSFLDARSKDPKKSRPKDTWYVVLKGKVLYLYEDEEMTECEAAVELGGHDVVIYPEGLLDGELFAKRNAICLKPKPSPLDNSMPSVTKEMMLEDLNIDAELEEQTPEKREKERERLVEEQKKRVVAREEALDSSTPWFIFVRSNIEMEDWYFALIHASDHPTQTPTLAPLRNVFQPSDMHHLVATLDEQPDVIPMRWLNALIGRIFFSYYRTHNLEAYIIGRLMKKLSKVKRPNFLTDIVVTEVSVGNKAPTFSKPMLKELTKEGDAALEVHLQYKGEIRITIEATATINLGTRFKSYTVKLVLAAVLKELEGNLLIKVKRPPSNRIWYAFTQNPRMVLEVEPVVSDRQITWNMILSTIESRLKEIVQESIVMPNMDDIAFFESSAYEHRGGIWSDASRQEKPPSSMPSEQLPDENQPAAPASVLEASVAVPIEEAPPRSQSAEELTPNVSPSPAVPIVARSSTAIPSTALASAKSTRRRSWFSSVKSDEVSALLAQEFYVDEPDDTDAQRGRTTDVDKGSGSRSHSTPHKAESIRSESSDQDWSEDSQSQSYLSPQSARRSSSNHSTRSHAKSTSIDSVPESDSARSTTSKASAPGTPASPTSFLSTLKSRAGDKQALSNTAKEAMRKWGVNWGGLKKDSNTGTGEDLSDHGSIGSRLRPDSINGLAQIARTSYAEVRAAVAERKGRDKNSSPENLDPRRPSSPIAIPIGEGKVRSVSNASTLQPGSSSPSHFSDSIAASSSATSSGRPSTAEGSSALKTTSPAITRTNTSNTEQEASITDIPRHTPIHVQPQAKMMTIPGIHASHRGDVMSMGYVAPQPTSPTPSENKLNASTSIQSVYRLWKSPVLTGQQAQEALHGQAPSELDDKDPDVAPLALPPNAQVSQQPPSRPVPPPLPPRSIPTGVSRPAIEPLKLSSDALQSSASEALKSIATKDENTRTRASLENGPARLPVNHEDTEGLASSVSGPEELPRPHPISTPTSNPGPPLPPRRVQAPA